MIKLENIGEDEWCFDDSSIDFSSHEKLDSAIDYWHGEDFDQAVSILRSLISENPYHIDVYHHLSLIYQSIGADLEAYAFCREAVRIGLSSIPKKFSWKTSKLDWGHLGNRPFLRAYHNLGLWHEERGEVAEAIQVYKAMLSVCPNDNIGARYLLPRLCFLTGDLLSIVRLINDYPDDYSPDFLYNKALAFVLLGEIDKANTAFNKAKSEFPLIAKEILKKRNTKPNSDFEGYITIGSPEQAHEYWEHYGQFWKNSPEAMRLAASN